MQEEHIAEVNSKDMICKYTKKQILETIKHWQGVLRAMNEDEDQLIQSLADAFEKTKLFSRTYKTKFNDFFFKRAYDVLNVHFFSSKLDKIPIFYKSDAYIRQFVIKRGNNESDIPKMFFGTHSAVLRNNPKTLKPTDDLILYNDVILLNKDYIEDKSLVFAIACLCHEMIHYYDRRFGEYCTFAKYQLLNKTKVNMHNTMTFENLKDKANDLGINVIQEIPNNKDVSTLDSEAVEVLMKKLQTNSSISESEQGFLTSNPSTIVSKSAVDGHWYITTF